EVTAALRGDRGVRGAPGGERPAVDRGRREPRDLGLQARQRIVVEDDAVARVEHHLAAEAPRAARRFLLEVVCREGAAVHVHLARVQKLPEHVSPHDYPAACAIGLALVRGKSMTNVVPLPTSLATLMR